MSSWLPWLAAVAMLASSTSSLFAGDHTDSPMTRGNQAADLADAYVFPIASTAGGTRVAMVLTVHPYASPPHPPDALVPSKRSGSQLSDAVEYLFRLRPAAITGSGAETRITTDAAGELTVTCTVDDAIAQSMRCKTSTRRTGSDAPTSLHAEAEVDTVAGSESEPMRIFGGCRADPFFTDPGKLLYSYLKLPQVYSLVSKEWVAEATAKSKLGDVSRSDVEATLDRLIDKIPDRPIWEVIQRPLAEDNDWWSWTTFLEAEIHGQAQWLPLPTPFIRHSNVLAIVVELELEKAYGGPLPGHLFALVAETRKNGKTIDRDARPATNNLLFAKSVPYVLADQWIPELAHLQDIWNRQDSFALDPKYVPQFTEALLTGAKLYDSSDGQHDWDDPNPAVNLILTDHLLFDTSLGTAVASSDAPTYFEIEMSHYRGQEHRTFGGRLPNTDSIDTFLTWFINGPDRYDQPRRTDGEEHPAAPASDVFPYLQPPHPTGLVP